MQIYSHTEQLRELQAPICWAMGFFDGVHSGHRRVMHAARAEGALRGVLTFDRHPLTLLRPESAPRLLTPDAHHKADLISQQGEADVLLRLPFTPELAALSPTEFLDMLGAAARIAAISIGENWRFGRGGCGSPELLLREGAQRGFAVHVQRLMLHAGLPVSSSRTRAELASGHLDTVAALLGRPFAIVGKVERGQQLARKLGFPTANIALPSNAALPPFGVYRVRCHLGSEARLGIANLGLRPTIQEAVKIPRLEVHLPGWQGDLYGERLIIEPLAYIRPERSFPSLDALKQQMRQDIASACFAGACANDQ